MRRFVLVVAAASSLIIGQPLFAADRVAEPIPAPEPQIGHMPLPARRPTSDDPSTEVARLRYRMYRHVEYPLQMKQLDTAIQLASAEIRALDRQIFEYESISRARYSNPFLVTLESAKMRRLAVELQLRNLRQEKLLWIQNFHTARRLRQLEMEATSPQPERMRLLSIAPAGASEAQPQRSAR